MPEGLTWIAVWAVLVALLLGVARWVRTRPSAPGGYWRIGRWAWIAAAVISILIVGQVISVVVLSRGSQFEVARRAVVADPSIAKLVGGAPSVRLSWFNSGSFYQMGPVTMGNQVVSERCAQARIALVAVGSRAKQRVLVYLLAAGNQPWRVQRIVAESWLEATARKPMWDFSCE